MRARVRPLFLRTVFKSFFRISQSNGKNENPKTDISALKAVFGFRFRLQIRNPDFKIENQISQSNAPKNVILVQSFVVLIKLILVWYIFFSWEPL